MVELGAYIYLDKAFIPREEAQLPILTHSLHYGMAVFDGIRCYQTDNGPQVFRLKEHAQRFVGSCKIVGMPIDVGAEEVEAAILETIRRNGHSACYIRPLAFYGTDRMGLNTVGMRGHVAVLTWEWGAYLGDDGLLKGIRVKTASYTRHHPNITMVRAKVSGNYVNSQMAKAEAVSHGYDEALMMDPEGFVVEGTGENIFIVEDGELVTPPQGSILPGITRDTVMRIARREGIPVREERLTRDRVLLADEVFLTGTAAEITPVREVDGRVVGSGAVGPVCKSMQATFFKVVGGELPGYAEWLAPVNPAKDGAPVGE